MSEIYSTLDPEIPHPSSDITYKLTVRTLSIISTFAITVRSVIQFYTLTIVFTNIFDTRRVD